jgi:hypothetical protein
MKRQKRHVTYDEDTQGEQMYPLIFDAHHLIGKKATAVYFGDERVAVKNWREVFRLILSRCNQERHDELMNLRDKVSGKVHTFLSASPSGMKKPFKIDDELFADSGQYGTETLLHILRDRILKPAGYDYLDICIALHCSR